MIKGILMNDTLTWIWQQPNWPDFYWQEEGILPKLRSARLTQGILLGKAGGILKSYLVTVGIPDIKSSIQLN